LPPMMPPAAFRKSVVWASLSPVAYGCAQTSEGNRDTLAAPRFSLPPCATASTKAAKVTESRMVPMWLVVRPGQTPWIEMLLAPSSADVGCFPPCGCTVSSVSDRTVV